LRGVSIFPERVSQRADKETKFVTGHGRIATKDELVVPNRDMSVDMNQVQALVHKGMPLEQVKAAKPQSIEPTVDLREIRTTFQATCTETLTKKR
jgi:hypothetical protein